VKVDATVCRTVEPGDDLRSFTQSPVYPDPEPCNITAANGVSPDANQAFTLTVTSPDD